MATISWLSLMLLLILYTSRTCHANNRKHNGMSFKLIHRNSLDSPLYHPSNQSFEDEIKRLMSTPRLESTKLFDKNNNLFSNNANNQVIRPSLIHQPPGLFLVKLGIGTFSGPVSTHTTYLLLDTGGHFTWTQCEGCNPCFRHRNPDFPRNRSQTYHALPCNQCPQGTMCKQDHCTRQHSYQDGTFVQGVAARETFVFMPNTGGLLRLQNLDFTCVIRSQNFNFGKDPNNIACGVLGMNRHPSSFISQVGERFGGRFSYCLIPSFYRGEQPNMFLRFGDDIPSSSLIPRYRTPLLQARSPYYYVDLRSISIGSEKLKIDPSVFQLKPNDKGGCIMDTGFGAGRLIDVAYIEFERLLTHTIMTKNPGMTVFSRGTTKCYTSSHRGQRAEFPTVTLHFANDVNLVARPEAYMHGLDVHNPLFYCLLIIPSPTMSVIAANLQANHQITYDIVNSVVYLTPKNCFSDN